ncbi:hypothetical protein EYF80_005519 [Liparis tanakae]|uniref:Uncharacterized protein n=1 Tax=Liparis tanakae TaxID=230148 RepID=A0A4Z2J405_9TELE|nr:hypothetical protein EYF80_005519 [Liparis tanakae]
MTVNGALQAMQELQSSSGTQSGGSTRREATRKWSPDRGRSPPAPHCAAQALLLTTEEETGGSLEDAAKVTGIVGLQLVGDTCGTTEHNVGVDVKPGRSQRGGGGGAREVEGAGPAAREPFT